MRRAYRRLLAMVMALTLALSGTQIVTAASVETVNINLTYGQTEARSMLTYINQFRQSTQESPITIDSYNYTDYAWYLEEDNSTQTVVTGLGTVSYDYGLEMVAMQRAAEIAVRWAHSRPNGGEWYDVYSELGLSYSAAGENLAAGHSSVEFAFVGLAEKDKEYYDEQGHRRNTLDSRWAYVGIGHVVCNECHYWAIEYSSTATGVGETAANDSAATVSVKVSSDYYTASGITLTASAVEVTPSSTATVPSLSGQLSSSVIWPNNSINITSTPTWTVSDGSIASISGNTVTGLKNGSTTATANFLGTSLSFTITASGFPEETTTEEPTTEEPTTEEPTTEAPTTEAPTTQAPTTEAPTTEAPTTQAPTTEAPTTQAPTTEAPTTEAPTTQAPTTEAPEETTEEPEAEETTAESTEEETTEEETTKETTQDITEDDIATGRDGGGSLEGDFWERFLGLSGDEPTLIGIVNDSAIGYETDYCVGRFFEIIGMGLEGICELGQ